MAQSQLFRKEISAWTPPEELTIAEWADRYRVLDPITSSEPGPWQTDRVPYLHGIFEAFQDPRVEQVSIMASTQVAKTETMLNILGYIIDQDPGPTLFVMPREADAKKMASRRFRPMLESSPRLKRYLADAKSDRKVIEYRLGQALVSFAWANSPAALASTPARYLLMDEVDKYPAFSGKEADPISLAEERQRTFWNRKRVLASTPTTADGYISRAYEASTKCRFHVPCPRCGSFQVLVFPSVRWPEDVRDPVAIKRDQLAVYRCQICEEDIQESEKRRMIAGGVWCPEGCTVDDAGEVQGEPPENENAGFHLNALVSPWLTFSEVAAKFLEAKNDTPRLLNFVNSWLGEKWEELGETISPEYLASRAAPHVRGEVPVDSIVLTAGVDVQANHLYYTIRAWARGETSYLVQADRVESWEALLAVLTRTPFPVLGRKSEAMRVRLACIDSGYRTNEVYEICRRFPDVLRPVKGQDKLSGGVPIRMTRPDRNFQGQMARTGIKLWHLDTSFFKDKLVRLMQTPLEEAGAWRVHHEPAQEYLREVTAEHKVINVDKKSGRSSAVWTKRPGWGGNHWLDCEVYALAGAEMLSVWAYRDDPTDGAERPGDAGEPSSGVDDRGARGRQFDQRAAMRGAPKSRTNWVTGRSADRRGGWWSR